MKLTRLSFKQLIHKSFLGLILVLVGFYTIIYFTFQPSHDRIWELGQEELPRFAIDGDNVTVYNYRNFDWQVPTADTKVNYETRTFNLGDLHSVDVFISHFSDWEGMAHIFTSFRFGEEDDIVISVESRRESHESFSPILGLLRQYELIYVVGSEEDIVGLRTDVREDERVYVYETVATPEFARELFLTLAAEVNQLNQEPEVYNTLVENCTNKITRKVEEISEINLPLTWKTVLPGYYDEVLYEMELIDQAGTFEEVKTRHLIDKDSVNRYSPTYSSDLRKTTKVP